MERVSSWSTVILGFGFVMKVKQIQPYKQILYISEISTIMIKNVYSIFFKWVTNNMRRLKKKNPSPFMNPKQWERVCTCVCLCVCVRRWRQADPADGGDKRDGGHERGHILRLPW